MFKRFEVLADTPEMTIEALGERIEIRAGGEYVTCSPGDVMDAARPVSFDEMKKEIASRNESLPEWIRNWYLRFINE